MNELYKPKVIREIFEKFDFSFSKSLGQNFLIDQNIIHNIIEESNITKEDTVLEVGPGFGTMTEHLADAAKKVIAVELDDRLLDVLAYTLREKNNVEVVHQDILKVDLEKLLIDENSVKVVANLPYYITTPILTHFMENKKRIDSITVMVQKEVAQRMTARENSKDYGSLSVFIQSETDAKIIAEAKKTVFIPQPKVDSAVVYLKCKELEGVTDRKLFYDLVHSGFQKRRKNIRNSLTTGLVNISKEDLEGILQKLSLDHNLRAENLSIQNFKDISNSVLQLM